MSRPEALYRAGESPVPVTVMDMHHRAERHAQVARELVGHDGATMDARAITSALLALAAHVDELCHTLRAMGAGS